MSDSKYQDGLYMEVVSYTEIFNRLTSPPLLLNSFDISSKEGRDALNDAMITKYDGDTLSTVPSCHCGSYQGARYIGVQCESCLVVVDYTTDRPIESMLWVKTFRGIPAFFNLTIWRFLRNRLKAQGGFSILEWLCDPFYTSQASAAAQYEERLANAGLIRGMANFIMNYEKYLDILFENRLILPTGPVRRRLETYEFLKDNIHNTFSAYLPFPSRLVFITEKYNGTTYADETMTGAIEASLIFANIAAKESGLSQGAIEKRVTVALSAMDDFYDTWEKDMLLSKSGIYRKLIFGTKSFFVFRAVITSLHDVHDYNALEFPWSLSVSLFTLHLSNMLLKLEFTPQDIMSLISESSLKRHPLIEKLMDELILNGTNPVTVTWYRPPSLERGSFEANKPISKVKKNPSDNTVGTSDVTLHQKNSDKP